MMRFNSLKNRQKHFLSFTGLSVSECEQLLKDIQSDWENQRIERLSLNNPNRQRKLGGGRKKILNTLEDQLLLTLIWAKLYLPYILLEYLFGIDESTVCRTIQVMLKVIQGKFVLPERRKGKRITTIEELKKLIPDLDEILVDGTEQPIPRPKNKRKRNRYHSGKKKRFTVKTQITTTKQGLIVHLSRASPGRKHDYKLFKESNLRKIIPKRTKIYLDSGYQGIQKDFPNLNSIIPSKRTRKHQEITRSEKIQNKKQRRIRVKVEHTLSQLKKYRVLSDVYRHSLQNYDSVFGFIANIVNFRMLQRLNTA
jgi:hypothetical protein